MKFVNLDTNTTFRENSKMKKLRKKITRELGLEESEVIRKSTYKALNIEEDSWKI